MQHAIGGRLIRGRWQDGLEEERPETGRPHSRCFGNPSRGRGRGDEGLDQSITYKKGKEGENIYVFGRRIGKVQPWGHVHAFTHFLKKVLMEHSHARLVTYCLWLLSKCNCRVEQF